MLVGEASYLHNTLKKGLRELGHEVTLMSDGNGWHDSPRDIDLRRDIRWGKLGGLKVLWRLVENMPHLRGNDVVQIHNYQFVPLKMGWNMRLIDYLKRNNRCLVKGCFGDDPRIIEAQLEGVPAYSDIYWSGKPRNMAENKARIDEQRLPGCVACWRKAPGSADALAACLYEYYMCYDVPPYGRKLRYMPLPMELPSGGVARVKGRGSVIKVLVGVQADRDYMKGAVRIAALLDALDKRNPGRLDIRRVSNVPYDEYCLMLDEADVLVDQLYSFTPSMNSLAAMARGTVVIGGGEEDFYRFIGEDVLRPIINVSPELSFEENVAVLGRALLTGGNVEELSRQSIEFVRKYHDYRQVAAMYEKLYTELLDGK